MPSLSARSTLSFSSLVTCIPDHLPTGTICGVTGQHAYTANNLPTCEGAIQLAMEQTDFTLQGARCLVIGCGRIGALLARKLHALDALVTVSARSARDFARIEAAGLAALDTRRLAGHLDGFDLVFNTVPAPVLGASELAGLKPGCVVIDLASLPGGISPDVKLPPACRVLHALSLPGRVAPLSAARAIHDTVCAILQEEGVL
ncbi:MAG TPA: dipicolinate synthase [Candidatus Agathobaculum pullistercoris]|nr:dipicolinate synthase [Candidatus Agathobaculum pullistercoris]